MIVAVSGQAWLVGLREATGKLAATLPAAFAEAIDTGEGVQIVADAYVMLGNAEAIHADATPGATPELDV